MTSRDNSTNPASNPPPRRRTYGTGSIRKQGRNRWELRVRYRDPDDLRRRYRQVSRTFHGTKCEARKALAMLVAAVQADHRSYTSDRPTLGELVSGYLENGKARGLKSKTLYSYLQLWKIAVEVLGDKCPDDLHPDQVDRYFQDLLKQGRGAPTINRLRAFLSSVGNWAIDKRKIDTHPFAATTKIPHRNKPTQLGSAGQIRAVYRRALDEDLEIALVIRLGATLGSRRGEICGQQWHDVDWTRAQVRRRTSVSHVPAIEVGDIRPQVREGLSPRTQRRTPMNGTRLTSRRFTCCAGT